MKPRKSAQLGFDWDAPVASQDAPQPPQASSHGPAAKLPTGQPAASQGHWLRQPWHPCYTAWWAGQPLAVQLAEQARLDREAAENPDHAYLRDFLLARAARCEKESQSCSAASSTH